MSISGLHQFERTIQTTNHWLNDILKELETDDRQTATTRFVPSCRRYEIGSRFFAGA